MKVTMTATISGTRNGENWPPIGESLELPAGEAKDLILAGQAVKWVEADEVETATLSTPERAEPIVPQVSRTPAPETAADLQPVPAVSQFADVPIQVPHQPGTPEQLKGIPITTDADGNHVATDEAVPPVERPQPEVPTEAEVKKATAAETRAAKKAAAAAAASDTTSDTTPDAAAAPSSKA